LNNARSQQRRLVFLEGRSSDDNLDLWIKASQVKKPDLVELSNEGESGRRAARRWATHIVKREAAHLRLPIGSGI